MQKMSEVIMIYTLWAIKRSKLIFLRNFAKNRWF